MRGSLLHILFSYIIFGDCVIPPNVFISIIAQFKMMEIVIQGDCFTLTDKHKLMSQSRDGDYMISFNQNMLPRCHSLFTCTKSLINSNFKIPVVVVFIQNEYEIDLNEIDISVGQAIYFVEKNTFKIYEAYEVNYVHVIRYLGKIHENDKHLKTEFVPADDYIYSFEERRGDFHGLQIIGMVEDNPPAIYNFPDDFEDKALYFPENDTYDLTDMARGSYIELLHYLEKTYNFSTKLYKRKDGKWGSRKIVNGSVHFTGMLQSLMNGPADLICAQYSMLFSRLSYLDFLPAITQAYGALFISHGNYEVIDWTVFLIPFTMKLWIGICVSTISFMVGIKIMEQQYMIEAVPLVSWNVSEFISIKSSINGTALR